MTFLRAIDTRYVVILGIAIAPLAILTAMSFFPNADASSEAWTPPAVEEAEKLRATAEAELKKKLAGDGRTAIVDPAGFATEGEPAGELSLPYELAHCLAAAERARHSDDLAAAEAARNGLVRLIDSRLAAVQKIRPNGENLASDLRRRSEVTARRCAWLTNRQLVSRELKAADAAMAAGPEGAGETSCLATVAALRKQLPAIASPESIADEPGDSLTPEEVSQAKALEARATFRRSFFRAREATVAEAATAKDRLRLLAEWASFLGEYGKRGAPDPRDRALIDEARSLQRRTQLELLRSVAREQSSAADLATHAAAWLKEAAKHPAEIDEERKAAREMVRTWLEDKVPALDTLPKAVAGVQEGFTATKRLVGFFEKVKGTEAQYRWWRWDTNAKQRRAQNKGDKQMNLTAAPAAPKHAAFAASYADARKAFLSEGFGTRAGVDRFRSECERLDIDFAAYRQQWDDTDFPADKTAERWGEVFSNGRMIADDLLTHAEKHGLWQLFRGDSPP
jgi:hypothetical protein